MNAKAYIANSNKTYRFKIAKNDKQFDSVIGGYAGLAVLGWTVDRSSGGSACDCDFIAWCAVLDCATARRSLANYDEL